MLSDRYDERARNEPSLDLVEHILEATEWSFEREGEEAVHCIAPTRWGEFGGIFAVRDLPPVLQFSVTLDIRPTPQRRSEVNALIVAVNARLPLGHFDYWKEDNLILFRHAIALNDRAEPEAGEISAVIMAATQALDRFIPALNYVIWAGQTADQAMEAAIFDTNGEA